MAKQPDSVHKNNRQGPGNNNAYAAGPTRRVPVPELVKGGAFGAKKGQYSTEQLQYGKGGQKYDGQKLAHRKQNNADPFPKNLVPVNSPLKVSNGRP